LGKIHDSAEIQQYAHGLAWYMYGAYVTIEFVRRCSCMPSISRINNLLKFSLPTKTFLTSTSSSFTSQISPHVPKSQQITSLRLHHY